MSVKLTWAPAGDFVDLPSIGGPEDSVAGVYLIWRADRKVVRLGQGLLRQRLVDHRNDRTIMAHQPTYFTWAACAKPARDGVEKYLADRYNPIVGDRFPDREAIEVNLP